MAPTPRILIAVVNCHARPIPRQMLRDTWVPRVPQGVDLRFFLGPSLSEPLADEVYLQCDDSYFGLPSKVQGIFRWALEHGYEYCLKLDEDCILFPELWAKGFLRVDFSGPKNISQPGYLCPWGYAYVCSRKAMECVVKEPLPLTSNNDEFWVTNALAKYGIGLQHDPRYCLHKPTYEQKKRTLRAPPRPTYVEEPVPEAFAHCVWMPGDSPEKQAEYMKAWEKLRC